MNGYMEVLPNKRNSRCSFILFYFELGPIGKNFHQFDQYFSMKCLISFSQSAVNRTRQADENWIQEFKFCRQYNEVASGKLFWM